MKYFLALALLLAPASRAAAQNPAASGVPSSSGHISSRFLPADLIQRLAERPEDMVDSVSFSAPIDSVWLALKAAIKNYDLPLGFEERSSWELGNQGAKIYHRLGSNPVSNYLRCGDGPTGPRADSYVVYLTFISVLRPNQGAGVALYTGITGQAVDLAGGRNDPINCATTGRFEQEVGKQVRKELFAGILKKK
jgi:hypothetical protein